MKEQPRSASRKILLFSSGGVLLLAAIVGYVLVGLLSAEVANLKQSQLPQKEFDSYEDCQQNGGKNLQTINGGFAACLGGEAGENTYQAFLQYSAQNLPRIQERKTTDKPNTVDGQDGHSADLITFLQHDYSGCEQGGYYRITKEVPNRFALMTYGCNGIQTLAPSYIIAMKLADGWALLSPTDNMADGQPSCLLADMFKISKELSAQCFENTGFNNGQQKDIIYP